jgi:hypothetical protein
MQPGTNDLQAAYGYVGKTTNQTQYTCVAVWDDGTRRVRYCDVPGHNFGRTSAVVIISSVPSAMGSDRALL